MSQSSPQPTLPWWSRVYNYTSRACPQWTCRQCWEEVENAPNRTPSRRPDSGIDSIWITPNFFRFQEEAIGFLALPDYNQADVGLYLDISPGSAGSLPWRICPGTYFPQRPGGALEFQLPILDAVPYGMPVDEAFATVPIGQYVQKEHLSVNPWFFGFDKT